MFDSLRLLQDLLKQIEGSLDEVRISPDHIQHGRVIRVAKSWGFIHADPRDVFFELKEMHIPEISSDVVTFRKATTEELKRARPLDKIVCYILGEDRGRGPRCEFWYFQSDFEKAKRQSPLADKTR